MQIYSVFFVIAFKKSFNSKIREYLCTFFVVLYMFFYFIYSSHLNFNSLIHIGFVPVYGINEVKTGFCFEF